MPSAMQSSTPKSSNRSMTVVRSPGGISAVSTPQRPFVDEDSFVKHSLEDDMKERAYLPAGWLEDKRMEVVFAPFRARDLNPEGWATKMAFWEQAVNAWCLSLSKATFTLTELSYAFRRGDQQPSPDCLKLVMSHMARQQKIIFQQDLPGRSSRSVSKRVFDWTVGSVFRSMTSMMSINAREIPEEPSEKILPNIQPDSVVFHKETLDGLLDIVPKWTQGLEPACEPYQDYVMRLRTELFSGQSLEDATLDVLIGSMEGRTLSTATESGIRIVKYGKDIDITEGDVSLIKLDAAKKLLQGEVDRLEAEIVALQADARQALELKNRDKAMLILKKKKRIESKVLGKETQIDNIEQLRFEITNSHANQAVIEALDVANKVLKANAARLEQAEDTVSQVSETLDDIAALNSELNRPLAESAAIDNDAEAELNELLKDIEQEKAAELAEKTKREKEENEAALLQQLSNLTIISTDMSSISSNNTSNKVPEPVAAADASKAPEAQQDSKPEAGKTPEDKAPEAEKKPAEKADEEPMLA